MGIYNTLLADVANEIDGRAGKKLLKTVTPS
jgi:hypothetical protein